MHADSIVKWKVIEQTVKLVTLPSSHKGMTWIYKKKLLKILEKLRWWCFLWHKNYSPPAGHLKGIFNFSC